MPPDLETSVSRVRLVASRAAVGRMSRCTVPVPSRLRKYSPSSARRAPAGQRQPAAGLQRRFEQHAERHHGQPFSAKYQASGGTSYSASISAPAFVDAQLARRPLEIRDMKW